MEQTSETPDAAELEVGRLDTNPAARASMAEFRPAPVYRGEHQEGSLTRLIEQQTARIPSHWFLFAGLGSMGLSLGLELMGRSRLSRFVGMWPPALLVTGVYNKLVKSLGPR